MLAEEGDDLSAIKVPSDLGPEGSSGSSSAEAEPVKEEPKEEKKEEVKETKGAEPEQSGPSEHGGHKEIKHPKHLMASVTRL
jgi:hypothetical protein